jgi:hypothetical protein
MEATGILPVARVGRQKPSSKEIHLGDEKTYSATYVGSGTFLISKPKRKRSKLRQSRLKNPQRGARK